MVGTLWVVLSSLVLLVVVGIVVLAVFIGVDND